MLNYMNLCFNKDRLKIAKYTPKKVPIENECKKIQFYTFVTNNSIAVVHLVVK